MPWPFFRPDGKRFADTALHGFVFLSGACGLLYQVAWHKYLAILLGSHARATAVVLALFLGGLAAGYAAFGKWSARAPARNWLRGYALIEVLLACWAVLFPTIYRVLFPVTGKLYASLGINSLATDLFVGLLLIGLPTFLMGGTLPLLTQSLSPDLKEASRAHARIYGANTVGAGFGTLVTGYWLVPKLGLEGSLLVGAAGNLVVASAFWFWLARLAVPASPAPARPKTKATSPPASARSYEQWLIVAVGFLSGFYVLTLETVLIRLMGLATGSSSYNFTLIVSVFVFCLGAGSLAAKRIGNFRPAHLFWNQALVAVFLFALYLSGDYWPYGVHVLRAGLRDIAENFSIYQFRLAFAFSLLLAIPIGLCGLTLPLCFHLVKGGRDQLGWSVGWLYGINTVGAVAGALVGGYWLLHPLNLDEVFKLCVGLVTLSACIAAPLALGPKPRLGLGAVSGGLVVLGVAVATWLAPLYTKENYIQPFRRHLPVEDVTFKGPDAFTKHLMRSTTYIHYEDDPNTSVGVGVSAYEGKEYSRTIFVNGKSDGNTRGDLLTTVMLGHIPGMLGRELKRTAVIGFGTGMTIGVLTLYPEVEQVDVLEISPAIIKNAFHFDRYNGRVTKNPKVSFHEMDAFRFFVGSRKQYDLVVSEPSNPWVSGVENLYASEFYELVRKRLSPDGMFVQWIHTYSFTDDLLKMVLRTMSVHFPYVSVFQLKGGDLALVARAWDIGPQDFERARQRWAKHVPARNTLMAYGVRNLETLLALEVVPDSLSRALSSKAPLHTLERPRLSNEAALAFFTSDSAKVMELRRSSDTYIPSIADSLLAKYTGREGISRTALKTMTNSFCDDPIAQIKELCEEARMMASLLDPSAKPGPSASDRDLASLSAYHAASGGGFSETDLKATYAMLDVLKRHYSPIVRVPMDRIVTKLETCLKATPFRSGTKGECLLQKILLFQMLRDDGPDYAAAIRSYRAWFKAFPQDGVGYAKFKEAHDILSRLMD